MEKLGKNCKTNLFKVDSCLFRHCNGQAWAVIYEVKYIFSEVFIKEEGLVLLLVLMRHVELLE